MKRKYIVIAALILAAGGGYYLYKKSHTATAQVRYITSVVEKGTLTSSISGSGNVIVDESANVDPTISGTVADLAVSAGDKVKKGQFLFNIINDQLGVSAAKSSASLEQAKNSVESARLQKKQAEADYDAAKDKDDDGNDAYSKKQLSVLKDKIAIAEAGIVAAEKSLAATMADYKNQQSDAAERKVVAPISGTVNAVNIKNGDDLGKTSSSSTSRQAPIIIGDLGTLKAQVEVNEVDISNVEIGQKAVLKLDAVDEISVTGKVEKIDSLGTVSSGVVTYNITIGFDTLDERIKPQMSVNASIITDVKQGVLTVPNSALKSEGSDYYVEALSGDMPERRNVVIGSANNQNTEVVSGVSAGDEVVTQTIDPNAKTAQSSFGSQNRGGVSLPGMGGGRMMGR